MNRTNIQRASYSEVEKVTGGQPRGKDFSFIQGPKLDAISGFDISEPFLLENLHLMLLRRGSISVRVNLRLYMLSPGALLVLGPGTIYQVESFSEDTACDVVIIRKEFVSRIPEIWRPALFESSSAFVLERPEDEDIALFSSLLTALAAIADSGRESIIDCQLAALVNFAAYSCKKVEDIVPKSRSQEIFHSFLRLVSIYCKEHRNINFYADSLALTPHHLGRIVKEYSGLTAAEWIQQGVLTEARVMLKHSDQSILAISEALGFPTDSFFCKYFKRLTGMTPKQYRMR